MFMEAEHLVGSCVDCLRFNFRNPGFHPSRSVSATGVWDHVELDLIGPLNDSSADDGGTSVFAYNWILVLVDVLTGFVVLRPLSSKNMKDVALATWHVICEYGPMRVLQ